MMKRKKKNKNRGASFIFTCDACKKKSFLQCKKPKPYEPTTLTFICQTCECKFHLNLKKAHGGHTNFEVHFMLLDIGMKYKEMIKGIKAAESSSPQAVAE